MDFYVLIFTPCLKIKRSPMNSILRIENMIMIKQHNIRCQNSTITNLDIFMTYYLTSIAYTHIFSYY